MFDLMAIENTHLHQTPQTVISSIGNNRGLSPIINDLGMAFDLGISNYVSQQHDTGAQFLNEPLAPVIAALPTLSWNVASASIYANNPALAHSTVPLNNQSAALKDFFSLFALTRSDAIPSNGTWDDLPVQNGNEARKALFGSGMAAGGLISEVYIGGKAPTQNPYRNINTILGKLGIKSSPISSHQSHFHIYLTPPEIMSIGPAHHLLAEAQSDVSIAVSTYTLPPNALLEAAQALLNDVQAPRPTEEGEDLMFTLDVPYVPYVPASETSVMTMVNTVAPTIGSPSLQPDYLIDGCGEYASSIGDIELITNQVDPVGLVVNFLDKRAGRYTDRTKLAINPIIFEGPVHGKLISQTADNGYVAFLYKPQVDYVGKDGSVFIVAYQGKQYKVVIDLLVSKFVDEKSPSACPAPKLIKVNKRMTGALESDVNPVSVTFADLPGTSVAETTGEGQTATITLDTTAAGQGWYVTADPTDTSEFLPTADPNIWQAKPGSAADGKMDLLSVLLHEYGHVLGMEHSSDNRDAMAATLKPGERHLWSDAELTQIASLIHPGNPLTDSLGLAWTQTPDGTVLGSGSTAPGLPTTPNQIPLSSTSLFGLGFLRRRRDAGRTTGGVNGTGNSANSNTANAPDMHIALAPAMQVGADHLTAANATLTNGTLTSDSGWTHNGAVAFSAAIDVTHPAGATLSESASAQAALRQVFTVGAHDRFLRFTVDAHLQAQTNGADGSSTGPADAFEAALLNADTGAALRHIDGLSHGDAFLNLQAPKTADGSTGSSTASSTTAGLERHATGIVVTDNTDGSRTYTLDLAGIAAGTDVELSFDLIGFGDADSAVLIHDVALLGDNAVAHDDAATTAEDTAVRIDVLANDEGVDVSNPASATPQVIAAPAHGTLVLNADRSYTYTPAANYFSSDRFTYTLVDASGSASAAASKAASAASAVPTAATVTLTITPINDAPVLTGRSVTSAEDTPLTLNLLATAIDVDGDPLTPVIVSGPTHGSLVKNVDGTYAYQAQADYFGSDHFTYQVSDGQSLSTLATVSLMVTPVNDAPLAHDADLALLEDGSLLFDLRSYGSDVDNTLSSLTATLITGPVHGTLTPNVDGTYTYTPNANFNGTDRLRYTLSDGSLASNEVVLNFTVLPVNDAPVLSAQSATTAEDTALILNLLSTASDVDGGDVSQLAAIIVASAAHGLNFETS